MNTQAIIIESIHNNLSKFLKYLTDEELIAVFEVIHMTPGFESHINGEENKEIVNKFLDEFIGLNQWCNYLQDIHDPKYFARSNYNVRKTINYIQNLIGPFAIKRLKITSIQGKIENAEEKLETINKKIELNKLQTHFLNLKVALSEAIERSYEDGIFYKDDGWCNVSEVLESYGLIKLKD